MKKKITKIILAVCLVVAGLPLFAIGARANDDANTNSEMMISVDNYFDYRNAKLILISGDGETACRKHTFTNGSLLSNFIQGGIL